MKTLIKCLLAGAALASLAGCASYDYGYAYGQPYVYYGYDNGPYYYGNGSYYTPYYDGGYPGYYYGTPGVGLSFGYSNRDYDHYDHGRDYRRNGGRNDGRDGNWRGGHQYDQGRDGRFDHGTAVTPPPVSRGDHMSNNPRSEIEAHPGPVGTNQQ